MSKLKQIFSSWRIWLVILFLIGSAVAINPKFGAEGVQVTNLAKNSSAELNGITNGLIIKTINGVPVKNTDDFFAASASISPGDLVKLSTNKGEFSFIAEEQFNRTSLGFDVGSVQTSNLKQGLDLVGGVRVILKPEEELSVQQFADLISITQRRLNTFGLQDISVKQISDLQGNNYLSVELAGTTKQQALDLVAQQGKFEAKIGNETIFVGGTDIKQVYRSADRSGIRSCNQAQEGWICQFEFAVDISPEAAKKHAEATSKLGVEIVSGHAYLDKKLDLYLDDVLVDSLYISENLKGIETTSFSIQGPGTGSTREAALEAALNNMKQMQTVLITGALPVKLEVVKVDIVSPALGEKFLNSALIAIAAAIVAVGAVLFARYRKWKIALALMLADLSEVFMILGIAALIKWNLDLAAIAAIIATIGTGVDHQIIITDEVLRGSQAQEYGWKEKIKRAFSVIFGAYSTTVAAMLPLWFLGSTMLKGFALITLIGISIGVFVTRPAYAKLAEILLKE